MKIILVNKTASGGGAAMASRRLYSALQKNGSKEVKILVQEYSGDNQDIISTTKTKWKRSLNFIRFVWERLRFLPYEQSKEIRFAFSLANTGENIANTKAVINSDIIHIHWINQGFLSINSIKKLIKLNKPIVWTMHDMWVFTGGCHYAGDCKKFKENCNHCPFLKNPSEHDLSSRLFNQKLKLLSNSNITFVGCSQWMALEAKSSKILKNANILSIPNPIDTELYKPQNKNYARKLFGLPTNKKIILFGAAKVTDKRKGLNYLVKAIEFLSKEKTSEYLLVTFGRAVGMPEFPIENKAINFLNDESQIASLYNAADVFVVPSIEDNLPNTIMESISCGVPVVAFNTGGIPEMIDHKKFGYLAEFKNAADFATGIEWVLNNNDTGDLSNAARNKALKDYAEEVVSKKFLNLYINLLEKK